MKLLSSEVVTEAYKVTKTLTGIECDICGRVIPATWHNNESKYYIVTTGHHDWGYESVESISVEDLCPDCVSARFSDFLANGSSTAYFKVETHRLYPNTKTTYMDRLPKEGEIEKEEHEQY